MARLRFPDLIQHLLSITMIARHEEDVAVLFASVVDLADGFIGSGAGGDGGLVDAGVADHVGGGEVVHEEFVLAGFDAVAEFVGDALGGHFGVEVVGGDFGGGDEVAVFVWKLFLDAAVEEEGDVGVFFGFGDVALVNLLCGEVFGEDVTHVLGLEGDGEGVGGVVGGHCCEGDVFGVGEGGFGAAVDRAEELGYFADAVGAVVEEEECIVVWKGALVWWRRGKEGGRNRGKNRGKR